MDTFKERQELEDLYSRGNAPWTLLNGGAEPLQDEVFVGHDVVS
jgi:hypothetical protein